MTQEIVTYNKLVRDRVPEIISAAGKQYAIEEMEGNEFLQLLKYKLVEEAREVVEAPSEKLATEIADVLEVVDTLIASSGLTRPHVTSIQEKRRLARGGFEKRLKLLWSEAD